MREVSLGSLALWALVMAYFAVFLAYPLSYVFYRALFIRGAPSLEYFAIMVGDPVLRQSIYNSFYIATASTVVTILVGYALAYVMVRYEFRLRGVYESLLLIPFIVPTFVGAIGMLKLFARYGSINLLLMRLGLISAPIDWFANRMVGIILLEILHLYPIAYLNIAASLSNIDPTLEESAETLGVTGLRKFLTVTLPLSLPGAAAAAAIVFIWSFTDLGTPLMFSFYKVVPVQIFSMSMELHENPMGYALTVFVLVLISLVFIGIKRYTAARSYEMLGRGHIARKRPRLTGPVEAAVSTLIAVWIAVAALPHVSIALLSVSGRWFMSVLPQEFTLKYYQSIFTNTLTATSIRNSIFYSVSATALAALIGLATAYVASRGKLPQPLRDLADTVSMWPLAIPGIALAFGYLSSFADVPLLSAYRDPTLLLIIAYTTRRLPYMVRSIYAGIQQVHRSLEEAALSLGSKPLKVVRDITLPLIAANIFAGAILVFAESMIEVSTSLMLALREQYYPITKTIYEVSTELVNGPELASALGMVLMLVVATSMVLASKAIGAKMGELFRA